LDRDLGAWSDCLFLKSEVREEDLSWEGSEEDVVRKELEFVTQYQQELATGQGKSGGVDEDARYLAGG